MIAVFRQRGCWRISEARLEAVEGGHADVHEHDGDLLLQEMRQGLGSRVGLDQVLTQIAQYGLVGKQFARLIIHQEDVDFIVAASHRRIHC